MAQARCVVGVRMDILAADTLARALHSEVFEGVARAGVGVLHLIPRRPSQL